MDVLAAAHALAPHLLAQAAPAGGESSGLVINLFWVIVAAANFVLFFAILWTFALRPVSSMLTERRQRIEEGLRDAEQARKEREQAAAERNGVLQDARREANDIIARASKAAQDLRESDLAATRSELERLRERAASDIESEKQRAIADLRAEVADLALEAAGKVVGESMDGPRQRRLVEEFLRDAAPAALGASATDGGSTPGAPTTRGRNG